MTALAWSTTVHTDVVCPPDPDAFCRHCGDSLEHHISTDGPEEIPTPATAQCWDRLAFTEHKAIRYNAFELADGERLDCPNVIACHCGAEVCSEHSTEFAACVSNSAVLHHLDCRHTCPDCADAARADARSRA